MGQKPSSPNPPRLRTYSTGGSPGHSGATADTSESSAGARARARSLGSFPTPAVGLHSAVLSIATASSGNRNNSPDSDSSTPEDDSVFGRTVGARSLPVHLLALRDIKCPVCSKTIPADDVECHLVMCLTKPRITYNEDVLLEDKGECVICLEDLIQGDTIARLPCLCIYHKGCLDKWFEKNRSCPEHPSD